MSLHKLTAGDGYTYLTRQVAASDSTEIGHAGLGDYYSQRGESPGRWGGTGLSGVEGLEAGQQVTETQMKALYGEGLHPDAEAIQRQVLAAGGGSAAALAAARLGHPFKVFDTANQFRAGCAERFGDYNATLGFPRDWPVPAPERSRIRTELGRDLFAGRYGRPPMDDRELSGFIARSSRQATTAVAGFDLTFTPVKSVSTLWAIAPREVAERIEAAHHAAVADTVGWLEREACYTRTGRNGVRQVETTGLIAAQFKHRDSRDGDPNLHTHVAISNKAQTRDGKWLALDGRIVYKATVAASERYNTRLEARLTEALGVAFTERPQSDAAKRPIREVVGVDPRLAEAWSSRRAAIEVRRAELAVAFQADHGRAPTTVEAIDLAQQANLDTRQAKHEPRSLAEQRAQWRTEAVRVLGSARAVRQITERTLGAGADRARPGGPVSDRWVTATAGKVVDVVSAGRATWQGWHLRAEAERQARAADLPATVVDAAVDRVVAAALAPARSVRLGPAEDLDVPAGLRRSDGASVYTVAGTQLYSSEPVMAAEAALVAAARRTDGRRVEPAVVDVALLEAAANGVELNPGQAQLVRELATSGARLQLAIAPAGSGKTTAMRVLGRAWADGGGQVLGLAPTAVAAAGLREQLGGATDTLAKLLWSLTGDQPAPQWVTAIGPDTLVVIDEAGMAGTADLARAVAFILDRGGSVRLVGDDQQLASIAAGGVLRDIASQVGAVTLSQLVRFTDPAEGAASIALRGGDPAGLGFYVDRGRVHVGDPASVTDQAYTGWAADRADGRDAVMLASTREVMATLNARARADRLAQDPNLGAEVGLADGNRASAGDVVTTRRNDRSLPITAVDWVKNGDRWTVRAVTGDGGLHVTHLGTGRQITLPAGYVVEHTELGYASTVHGAQGITADTCHAAVTGAESRQLLYVAATRGRHANHLYVATAGDGDPHSVITPTAVRPPTAVDVLTGVLGRDLAQRSAGSAAVELADPAVRLEQAAARYSDSLAAAAEQLLGPDRLADLAAAADRVYPGLTGSPAWVTLRAQLALLAVAGADPEHELTAAAAARDLGSAADPAAVLDWRLDPTGGHSTAAAGPLPWLPGVPEALATHELWGPYLAARAEQVTDLAAAVAGQAATWTPTTAPGWAGPLLDDPAAAGLRSQLAVWRAAAGVPAADRNAAGPRPLAAAEVRHHTLLTEQAVAVLGRAGQHAARWQPLADSLDERIAADPYWPELAGRLAAADRAGADAAGMLTAAAAQRPLPDEHPAAALWWRLSGHLEPAAVAATAGSGAATLRPSWAGHLVDLLDERRATRVLADPAWPALVAAVNTGTRRGFDPEQLLTAAVAGLETAGDPRLPARELAGALALRVALLTDPEPLDVDAETLPPDPADEDAAPPADLHLLPPLPEEPVPSPASWSEPPFDPWHDPAPPDPAAAAHGPDVGPLPTVLTDRGDSDAADYLLDEHFWATAVVDRARLVELNQYAAAFYAAKLPGSWAEQSLQDRLGDQAAVDPRFGVGYAPAGWTSLVDHLRERGAGDEEILAAGLGSRARTGGVIDRFRDRLVFALHGPDGDLHGFIGRRNPAADDSDRAGPKYLNTAETDLFSKGAQLFGLHEARDLLAGGATPVLVEGPLDAIAVTAAGEGRYVGVAPLGTAFTDRQADQLRPYLGSGQAPVIVGTDADAAGDRAAERAYWQLTARGDAPRRAVLPDGADPAAVLREAGPAALRRTLGRAQDLADLLIAARTDAAGANPRATAEEHVTAIRAAADVIGALPPDRWLPHIQRVTDTLQAMPGVVGMEVLDAGHAWTVDPTGRAAAQLRHAGARPAAAGPGAPAPSDTDRWRSLAAHIDPRLPDDGGWPALAAALSRAAAAGYDVPSRLPRLAAETPLDDRNPATDLRYRLHAATVAAAPPTNTETQWSAATTRTQGRPASSHTPAPSRDRDTPRGGPER